MSVIVCARSVLTLSDVIMYVQKESLGLNGSNGGLLAAGGGSTTTIGFGSSSSTSSSGSSSTTIGFGSAPSMSSGSSSLASAMNSSTVQGLPLEVLPLQHSATLLPLL